MIYRRLGRTGLKVSVLSIGGGVFDSNLKISNIKKLISFAVEKGMNLVDIGKNYDEEFISKFIWPYKKKLYLSVRSNAEDEKSMITDIKDSIKKLGIRPITIYQAVRIDNGVIDALEKAKEAGLINYVGIFSHDIELLEKAIQTGKFDVIVVMYNLVHRMAERLFKYAKKYDVGVLVIAPLATGILSHHYRDEEIEKRIKSKKALRFALSNKNITSAVIGTHNLSHIKENIEVIENERNAIRDGISNNERNILIKETESFLGKEFCRMCRLCKCPQGIQIADTLRLFIISEVYGCIDEAKERYSQQDVKFDVCNLCGECEKMCPYNLLIIKMLRKTDEILS